MHYPLFPHGFWNDTLSAGHRRKPPSPVGRKDQSDVLVPLFPLLIELAQFRKQAAERLYKACCLYRDQAAACEIALPYRLQYTDRSFSVTEDAPTMAALSIV